MQIVRRWRSSAASHRPRRVSGSSAAAQRGRSQRRNALAAVLALPSSRRHLRDPPNPFYDPDAAFAVLAGIVAVLAARDRSTPGRWLLAGALLSLPLLIKQNIGGPYLVSALGVLAAEAIQRPTARSGFRWCLAGLTVALGIELLGLQLVVGMDSFVRGIWTFAMSGRGMSVGRLREFVDPLVIWPGALIVILVVLGRSVPPRVRGLLFVGGLCVPLVASVFAPAVLASVPQMFPPLLIAAAVLAAARTLCTGALRRRAPAGRRVDGHSARSITRGVGLGPYGIFPLLVLAIAALVRDLAFFLPLPPRLAPLTGAVLALRSSWRWRARATRSRMFASRFIDVSPPGPVIRSTFPRSPASPRAGRTSGDPRRHPVLDA